MKKRIIGALTTAIMAYSTIAQDLSLIEKKIIKPNPIYQSHIDSMYNSKKYGLSKSLMFPKEVIKDFYNDTTKFMKFEDKSKKDNQKKLLIMGIRKKGFPITPKQKENNLNEIKYLINLFEESNIETPDELKQMYNQIETGEIDKSYICGISLDDKKPLGPSKNDVITLYKGYFLKN